jgi:putative nucleotidyltransferase with HDIG domain
MVGVAGLVIILVPIWMLRLSQLQYVKQTRNYVETVRKNHHALELQSLEISELNKELLVILADIVDMRDPYTHGHSLQVNTYAVKIAEELNLNADQIERVEKASLLHDIGKLGIPEEILFKPSRLTGEEFEYVKEHPVYGAKIMTKAHPLSDLAPIIRHHHERYDGRGYPDGLKGEDIPIEARIITLADSIEAMASDRPYRHGMDFPAILAEVIRNSGSQFDPKVVQAFLNLLNKDPNLINLSSANSVSEAFNLRMNFDLKVLVRRNNEGPETTSK